MYTYIVASFQTLQMKTILFCDLFKWITPQEVKMIDLTHVKSSLPGMAHQL